MTFELRRLDVSEVGRIAEIDRSESVTTGYAMRDGELVADAADWDVPPWSPDGDGGHAVPGYVASPPGTASWTATALYSAHSPATRWWASPRVWSLRSSA